jgi:predicted rRNA methylase YqxC with S4 and FtsJ domains
MKIDEFLCDETGICETRSEARRLVKQGGIYFNKERIPKDTTHVYIGGGKYFLTNVDIEETEEYKNHIKR